MSGAFLLRQAKEYILDCRLPADFQSDVLACLAAAVPEASQGPPQLFYELATSRERALGTLLVFASLGLLDDTMDGDCVIDGRRGIAITAWLSTHGWQLIGDRSAMPLFAGCYLGQHQDVATRRWTAERFIQVSELFAGGQYAAYMQMLGRPELEAVGRALGNLSHLAIDSREADKRFATLTAEDQRRVYEWGRSQVALLDDLDPALRRASQPLLRELEARLLSASAATPPRL